MTSKLVIVRPCVATTMCSCVFSPADLMHASACSPSSLSLQRSAAQQKGATTVTNGRDNKADVTGRVCACVCGGGVGLRLRLGLRTDRS